MMIFLFLHAPILKISTLELKITMAHKKTSTLHHESISEHKGFGNNLLENACI